MQSYPVNLFLENKKCLVVGGGKIAKRKIHNLLYSCADILVISPEFINEIKTLSAADNITLINRPYQETDLNGVFLVYAATNNKPLNKQIIASAKAKRILCCSIDNNWPDGNFITPASAKIGNNILTISTDGKHCRSSKFLKNIIADSFSTCKSPVLSVIGVDYKSVSFEELETVQKKAIASKISLSDWLENISGIYEFYILKTCNRFELIALINNEQTLAEMVKSLPGFSEIDNERIHVYKAFEAFKYLTTLVSGLQSQLIGENHIASQFKNCFLNTDKTKHSKILFSISNLVMQISKLIRNSVLTDYSILNLEDIFLAKAGEYFSNLENLKVVIAGTGEMGQSLAATFSKTNCKTVCLYHSRKSKSLFALKNVSIAKLSEFREHLVDADIFISSLSVSDSFFTAVDFPAFINCRLIFDVGIPRNISPELEHKFKDQIYIHFSSLGERRENTVINREKLITKAHEITESFYEKYCTITTYY